MRESRERRTLGVRRRCLARHSLHRARGCEGLNFARIERNDLNGYRLNRRLPNREPLRGKGALGLRIGISGTP